MVVYAEESGSDHVTAKDIIRSRKLDHGGVASEDNLVSSVLQGVEICQFG